MGSRYDDDDDDDDRISDRPSRRRSGSGRRRDDDDDYDDRPSRRSGFRCPYCDSSAPPISNTRVSAAGWVVMVLFILFFLPLFWVGLLIREEYRTCADCGRNCNLLSVARRGT